MHFVIDDSNDEYLLIGVFSSERKAREVAKSLFSKNGFSTSPKILTEEEYGNNESGFFIQEYGVDDVHWSEGFEIVE